MIRSAPRQPSDSTRKAMATTSTPPSVPPAVPSASARARLRSNQLTVETIVTCPPEVLVPAAMISIST